MFQNYNFSLSTSFQPARLVWGAAPEAAPAGWEKPKKKSAEVAVKAPYAIQRETHDQQKDLRQEVHLDQLLWENSEKVQKFVKMHAPETYTSSEWGHWNEEFLSVLGLTFVDSKEAQHLIQDIQRTIFKRLNLIGTHRGRIDGKLGPGSLRALSKYMLQGSAKLEPQDPIKGREVNEVLLVLDKEQLFKNYVGVLATHPEEVSDSFQEADLASFEGMLTDPFYEKVADFIFENQQDLDLTSPEGWRRAFRQAGLSEEEIEEVGLKADAEAKMKEKEASKAKNGGETNQIESPKIHIELTSGNEAVKGIVEAFKNESFALHEELNHEKTEKTNAVTSMKDDPYISSLFLVDLPGVKDAVETYQNAYKTYNDLRESKIEQKGFADELEAKNAAFQKLFEAVENYYKKLGAITERGNAIDTAYENEVKLLASKYVFPKNMPEDIFEKLNDLSLMGNVYAFPTDLKRNAGPFLSNDFEGYLKSDQPPVTPISSAEEIKKYLNGDKQVEIDENFDHLLKAVKNEGLELVQAFNSWVYLNNITQFMKGHESLLAAKRMQRAAEIKRVKGMNS